MSLLVFDNGRPMDTKLSDADLKRGIKLEEHVQVLDRYLDTQDGTYGWQGVLARGGNITVPKSSLKDQLNSSERAARVRKRMSDGPPLLVSYDTTTDTPIFDESDKEAYEDGYICPGCLQWQGVPFASECNWLRREPAQEDRDKGCGHKLNDR